jgi:hypothetical protein
VLRKGIQDYSMSQVTQIVESNNGKLLGLLISEADLDTVQITLKISLGPANDIIQTFRRYGYSMKSCRNTRKTITSTTLRNARITWINI